MSHRDYSRPSREDEILFNESVSRYGGRLDTAGLDPNLAHSLDYVAGRARGFLQTAASAVPALPPIHFDFVDNYEVNARAFEKHGRYFIGFYRGAVALISVLFDRMLADPQVLPFIGKAQDEAAGLPPLPDLVPEFVRSFTSVPSFTPPRDPARHMSAELLKAVAFDFLIAHEFAHIANGHLGHVNYYRGLSAVDELGGATDGRDISEGNLVSQTMEMDADATAVRLSLGSEWGKVVGKYARPGPGWDELYDRPGLVSLHWAWATLSLFHLFDQVRQAGREHPPPRLRSVMAQQAAGRVPRPEGLQTHSTLLGNESDNIPETIKAAAYDVENMFSIVTGKPEWRERLDEAWGDVGESQISRLQNYWRRILHTELLDFTYHPLLDHRLPGV